MKLAFVDTETTGTNPHFHEVWELAVVRLDTDAAEFEQFVIQVPFVNVDRLDPRAAEVNGFQDRYEPRALSRHTVAVNVAAFIGDARFCSCNVAFDTAFVREFLYNEHVKPQWHYSPIDVKSLCYGRDPALFGAKTDELIAAAGIEEREFVHNALRDAWLAVRLYQWATAHRHREWLADGGQQSR